MSNTKRYLYDLFGTDEVDLDELTPEIIEAARKLPPLTPQVLDDLEAAGANDAVLIPDWSTFAKEYNPREVYEEDDKEFPHVD